MIVKLVQIFKEAITLYCDVRPDFQHRCLHAHDTHTPLRNPTIAHIAKRLVCLLWLPVLITFVQCSQLKYHLQAGGCIPTHNFQGKSTWKGSISKSVKSIFAQSIWCNKLGTEALFITPLLICSQFECTLFAMNHLSNHHVTMMKNLFDQYDRYAVYSLETSRVHFMYLP